MQFIHQCLNTITTQCTRAGKIILFSLSFLTVVYTAAAQTADTTHKADQPAKISLKDAKEISYQAQATIDGLQSLLNYITFNDNTASELADVIANSYKPSRNRIFFNKTIIVEDDINPASQLGKTKDAPVEKYLNDLDLQYEKTADATITFSNFYISGVKKKEYIYVKVRFDALFGSKYKPTAGTYTSRKREALVRLDNVGNNKWQALIMGVSFYDPAIPTENTDNNMQVATDTSSTASVVSQEDFDKEKQSFILARQEEEKKQQAIFDEYVTVGNTYITNKQYKEALEIYEKAKDLKPLVPSLDKHIIDAKKLIAENTYENYKSKGDKAKSERKFNDAILFYNQAISLRPEASSILQAEITPITQKLTIISLPNNKLQAADLQGAIDECEKALKDHKKEKADYPELYYIEGMAYEKMAESKPDDNRDLEKALENFNLAVVYFPNYKDARLARADFFIKHKHDLVSAITDYDVLATNELNESPDKPLYFEAKAKLKDKLANIPGAIADYDQAIALSPATATFYYDKGELQYRTKAYADAEKNFNIAVKLNPKYDLAYYVRGLNFVAINNNDKAGVDFSQAEKLGLDALHLKTIDSISNEYFLSAQALADKHDFANADSGFNSALKIRICNANALHGKAEIRLITANELSLKNSPAAMASYNASIALNRQAIACKPSFSDLYFKEALAHCKIKEYDLAVACFTNAIKTDSNSVQAYIERGNTYQIQGKYAKAVDDYERSLIVSKSNLDAANKAGNKTLVASCTYDLSNASQLSGQAQYYLTNYPTAILSLNKALDYQQSNSDAFYYLSLVYYEQNELSKAIKNAEEAIKLNPQYKYYYADGRANFKSKNYGVAINNFSDAIKTDTLNILKNKLYLRGLSFYKNKQYDDAVTDFKAYDKTETAKTDTAFYADYGLGQLFVNQDTAAIKSFTHCLALSTQNARALYGLGCSYAKSGQFDKALDMIEKAFALHALTKDEIKPLEETFFTDFNKVKTNRTKYNELKKASFNTN